MTIFLQQQTRRTITIMHFKLCHQTSWALPVTVLIWLTHLQAGHLNLVSQHQPVSYFTTVWFQVGPPSRWKSTQRTIDHMDYVTGIGNSSREQYSQLGQSVSHEKQNGQKSTKQKHFKALSTCFYQTVSRSSLVQYLRCSSPNYEATSKWRRFFCVSGGFWLSGSSISSK